MDERCRIKEKFDEMVDSMCGFTPDTLAAINSQAPDFIETIHSLDRVANVDGAIDRKHKRLMALSCVSSVCARIASIRRRRSARTSAQAGQRYSRPSRSP